MGLSLSASTNAQTVSKDEYLIYSAVLREMVRKEKEEKLKAFVISDQTIVLNRTMLSDVRDAASRDLREKNKVSIKLGKIATAQVPVLIVAESRVRDLIKRSEVAWKNRNDQRFAETGIGILSMCGPDWSLFYEAFPGANGYYQFSRVGFNKKKTQAVVLISGNGEMWDWNQFFVFSKFKKRWRLRDSFGSFSVC